MIALTLLLVCLLLAVSAGLAADCYVNILTQPGQVLAFWARFMYKMRDRYTKPHKYWTTGEWDEQVHTWVAKRERIADYVLKPFLTCVYCVAGQLGFWLSVYVYGKYFSVFNPILSLLTAAIAIWFGGAFQAIQKKHFPL